MNDFSDSRPQTSTRSVLQKLRHLFRTQIVGRARRGLHRVFCALQMWLLPENNPFLQRALRTEVRRHRPLLTLAGILGFVLFALILISLLADYLLSESLDTEYREWWRFLPQHLGSNFIGLAALITVFICAIGAFMVSRARAAYLLRQEMLRGTLDSLQLMPIAEERWLWLMSAHPALLSLLIGMAGLPIYLLAIFLNLWSWRDLPGLALVFLLIGHAAPTWQPLMWRGQGKNQAQKVDWKSWQEAMKLARVETAAAALSPGQQLEAQRRALRIMHGMEGPLNPSETKKGEADTDASTRMSTQEAKKAAATLNRGGNKGWPFWIFFWGIFQFFSVAMRGAGAPGSMFSSLWQSFKAALPPDTSVLLGWGLFLSWPLFMARVLLTPLPFFAIALPPALLLIPAWAMSARVANWNLASQISASETFWTLKRVVRRQRVLRAIWVTLALLVGGYSWRPLIENGELGWLLTGAANLNWLLTDVVALAALWTLLLVIGTLVAATLIEGTLGRAANGGLAHREAWQQSLRSVMRVLAWTVGFYFVFCWLGARTGFNSLWLERFFPVIATVAAFLVAYFGTAALQSVVNGFARTVVKFLRWGIGCGFAVEALLRAAWGALERQSFTFEQAPHVLLSPYVSLVSLFRAELSPVVSGRAVEWWPLASIAWWCGPLVQFFIGSLCLVMVWPIVWGEAVTTEREHKDSWFIRVLEWLLWPFKVIGRVLKAIYNVVKNFFASITERLNIFNERTIARLEKFDNPVLTSEARRKVRKVNWARHWFVAVLLEILVFVSIAVPIGIAEYFSGAGLADWALGVAIGALIIAWVTASFGTGDAAQAFDRDRANGTLVFLFLTPMKDEEILRGKVYLQLAYVIPILVTLLPWILLINFVSWTQGEYSTTLLTLAASLVIAAKLFFSVHLQTLFAIRAQKPTEGMAKASLSMVIIVGALVWLTIEAGRNYGFDGVCLVLVAAAILLFILTFLCRAIALWSLRRSRYGDVTAMGKAVG